LEKHPNLSAKKGGTEKTEDEPQTENTNMNQLGRGERVSRVVQKPGTEPGNYSAPKHGLINIGQPSGGKRGDTPKILTKKKTPR